jgi:hypothetical protein
MFSGRYKQMFFSSNLGRQSEISLNNSGVYPCNLSSVTAPIDVIQYSTQASIPKMHPVTETQQRRARNEQCQQEAAFSKIAQSSKKDILETHPVKKRIKNNLVGAMRNNVINQLSLCL